MVDNLHECYSTANSDVIVVSPIIIVLTPMGIVFMDIGMAVGKSTTGTTKTY